MTIIQKLKGSLLSENLLGKSLRGGGILAVGSLIENLGRFVRNMILARLLAPEAFGLMATIISAVAMMEALTQVGMRQSTIQNKYGGEDGFLNTVWWISFLRGLCLYLISFFAAPYISAYFNQSDSSNILRIGFLVLLINGLISPRTYILEKELNFKKWVLVMQGSGIAGVTISIISAFILKNIWALLLGFLCEALLRTILSFILCPIKPKVKLDKKYSAEIMKFSRRMFGLPIIMMIYAQIDVFVVGKVLSIHQLGIYVLVKSLAAMPAEFFSKIVQPIALPVFASMQDDLSRLTKTLISLTRFTALFGIPFIAFLFLFADPILKIVYGYEYSELAIPFGLLCITTLITIISSVIVMVYFAIGKPHMHRTASLARTIIFLILIYPATKLFSITGVALVTLVAATLLILIQLIYARRVITLNIFDYLHNWLPGVQASLIIIIPGAIIKFFPIGNGITSLLIGISLCLTAWFYGIYKTGLIKWFNVRTS